MRPKLLSKKRNVNETVEDKKSYRAKEKSISNKIQLKQRAFQVISLEIVASSEC